MFNFFAEIFRSLVEEEQRAEDRRQQMAHSAYLERVEKRRHRRRVAAIKGIIWLIIIGVIAVLVIEWALEKL